MASHAKEGARLAVLVQMAVPICQQAEREHPRTGRGRKPTIPDWVIAVLIMVAVLKRRKAKRAQYRFVAAPGCFAGLDGRRSISRPEYVL